MDVVKTINLPDWIDIPETRQLMNVLGDDALLVGGCARNALLGAHATDVDIATKLYPDAVTALLNKNDIKTVPTGIDHGTVTAIVNGKPFEITTLRKDIESDGRRAVVEFADNWADDAQRRDFTLNTLLMDMNVNIYDPTGEGLRDLERGSVRFVGEARQRIKEDYLRILRFFRFHAWYGTGELDSGALAACTAAAEKISTLSKERITQEVLKLLAAPDPVFVLNVMKENNILPPLFHVKPDLKTVQRYYDFKDIDPIAVLTLLTDQEAMSDFLTLSNAQTKQFEKFSELKDSVSDISDKALKKLIYYNNNALVFQAVLLRCAREDRIPDANSLAILKSWTAPVFPVTGADLIREGFSPGPDLGAELQKRETAWLEEVL